MSKVPCLGAHRRSIFSAAGDRTRDLSLVRRARYNGATTPHNRDESVAYLKLQLLLWDDDTMTLSKSQQEFESVLNAAHHFSEQPANSRL